MAGSRERGKPVTLIEALEDYAAHHPESIDQLLQWPARLFERCYQLHQKRQIISGLELQRNEMIAALWSNSNWDDTKGTRKKAVDDITRECKDAIEAVEAALSPRIVSEEDKLTKDNPFFAAAERGLSRMESKVKKSNRRPMKPIDLDEANLDQT